MQKNPDDLAFDFQACNSVRKIFRERIHAMLLLLFCSLFMQACDAKKIVPHSSSIKDRIAYSLKMRNTHSKHEYARIREEMTIDALQKSSAASLEVPHLVYASLFRTRDGRVLVEFLWLENRPTVDQLGIHLPSSEVPLLVDFPQDDRERHISESEFGVVYYEGLDVSKLTRLHETINKDTAFKKPSELQASLFRSGLIVSNTVELSCYLSSDDAENDFDSRPDSVAVQEVSPATKTSDSEPDSREIGSKPEPENSGAVDIQPEK